MPKNEQNTEKPTDLPAVLMHGAIFLNRKPLQTNYPTEK
jgi:hypothetical protein